MKIKTATFIGIVIGTVGLMLTCSQPRTEGGHNLRSAARTGDEQKQQRRPHGLSHLPGLYKTVTIINLNYS